MAGKLVEWIKQKISRFVFLSIRRQFSYFIQVENSSNNFSHVIKSENQLGNLSIIFRLMVSYVCGHK